jgi:lysophospholipase L1-like esterase
MQIGRLKAILLGFACALMAQPPLTTIQDTVYKADGTRFNGSVTVSWKTFDASDTSDVAMQTRTVQIRNGALFVQLVPNTNATPVNYYNVLYSSDAREQFRELWAVPPSTAPLRVRDVRVNGLSTGAPSGGSTGGSSGGTGGTAGGVTSGGTSVTESQVIGLTNDLQIRPVKGPGFVNGRSAYINDSGQVDAVVGNAGDCVRVDGTSGPCFDAGLLATFVDKETPFGTINGTNVMFTLVSTPTPPASLSVYRNGIFQTAGTDFVLSGNSIQFAASSTPQPGDQLTASYRVGGNGMAPTLQINTTAPLAGGGTPATSVTLSLSDAAFLRRGHRAMVIGDSEAGGFTPDGDFPQLLPNWFTQAAVQSRNAILYGGNAGVPSDIASNMLARLQTDVISRHPDKVFIIAGYSDLNYNILATEIAGNVNQIVIQLKAANILAIVCTVPPQLFNPDYPDPNVLQQTTQLNLLLRKVATQQGVPLVDFYQLLADPLTTSYKTGYSADGWHPQSPATRLMAMHAIAATLNLFDQEYPYLPGLDDDKVNLIPDPLFLQTPSKWTAATVSGVAMQATIGTDPAIQGNTMTLTKTNTASVNTLTGTAVTTGFNPGDRLAFVGRIKSNNCEAGAMQFDVGLQFDPGAQTSYPMYNWNVDIKDGQWYVEIVVPAGMTSLKPVITLHSGTGSVTIGQVGVINLTQQGLI